MLHAAWKYCALQHPVLPMDAAGALSGTSRRNGSDVETLQRIFGADPSVRESSASKQSWSNIPTVYTHTTEIRLQV